VPSRMSFLEHTPLISGFARIDRARAPLSGCLPQVGIAFLGLSPVLVEDADDGLENGDQDESDCQYRNSPSSDFKSPARMN
jgi:hypothetical protein